MKKLVVSLVLAGVIVAAFGFVSTASAQGSDERAYYGQGGGRGGFGASSADHVENADVHNLFMEAWSAELGLSVEEIEAREESGETMAQIALSTGISFEDFRALKTTINATVADEALAAGFIDEAEYQWLIQAAQRQMNGLGQGSRLGTANGTPLGSGTGYRAADGTGYGMRRGAGQLGSGLGTGDCLVQP
jgi:hypothetical protein